MHSKPSSEVPILIVGSGNAEYVLELSGKLVPDQKHSVKYHELFGGSGVNYALRLLKAGLPVFPVLSIGNDFLGNNIRDEVLSNAKICGLCSPFPEFIASDDYMAPNIATPRATILVENQRRTIFSEIIGQYAGFNAHLDKCLAMIADYPEVSVKSVMIGHIQSDKNQETPGHCTKKIIDTLSKDCMVFANFGHSQIDLGVDFWENHLQRIHIFQLNLVEMKSLFKTKEPRFTLMDIIRWLNKHEITAIMTLDRFGAIGIYKGASDGIVLAWPSDRIQVVDPTGAGDAFGAGLMYMLWDKPGFSFEDFIVAIEEARVWAAYACTHLGGSAHCPDRKTLLAFYEDFFSHDSGAIEILPLKEAGPILKVFDKM
jgi:sugar/nucleoside kinase (ribokinase family)